MKKCLSFVLLFVLLLPAAALAEFDLDFLALPSISDDSALAAPAAGAESNAEDELADDLFTEDELDAALKPLSDEELMNILAQSDDSFIVLPDDFDMGGDDIYTLLLVGSDSYFNNERGRADCVIVAQINARNHTVKLASFLRDLYVQIPGKGHNRLNASYIYGGEKLLRKTLETNFGITVDAYVEVNFSRMIRVIDAIGGVECEVSEKEMRQVNSILRFYNTKIGDPEEDQLLWEHGDSVHLTGKQALCFARIRKIDGDIHRTVRQRKVIEGAFRKVASLDFAAITQLIAENIDAVNTDLTLADMMSLIPVAMRCRSAAFETMSFPSGDTFHQGMRSGMSVAVIDDMNKALSALWKFFDVE